jgi:hypothetical protein
MGRLSLKSPLSALKACPMTTLHEVGQEWEAGLDAEGQRFLRRKPKPVGRWVMAAIVVAWPLGVVLTLGAGARSPVIVVAKLLGCGLGFCAALWVASAQERFLFRANQAQREWTFLGFKFMRVVDSPIAVIHFERTHRDHHEVWNLELRGIDKRKIRLETQVGGSDRIDVLTHWLSEQAGIRVVHATDLV